MSKIIKLLLSTFICASVLSANAQVKNAQTEKEQTEIAIAQDCKPLLEKKCKQSKCMDINIFIDFIYEKCTNNIKDFSLSNNKDSRLPNSEIGYQIQFGKLLISAIGNEPIKPYPYYLQEYKNLKYSYDNFILKTDEKFLLSTNFLKTKKEKEIKDKFLNQFKSAINRIKNTTEKLDLMLQSEISFKNYRDSHLKFMPHIAIDGENDKFKNKEFSVEECSFLKLHFDSDFQKKINFTCKK